MSIAIVPHVVFPGGSLGEGNGYIVHTTVQTFAPICTKCRPVWRDPEVVEDGPYDSAAEAREVIEEHEKVCHPSGPGA